MRDCDSISGFSVSQNTMVYRFMLEWTEKVWGHWKWVGMELSFPLYHFHPKLLEVAPSSKGNYVQKVAENILKTIFSAIK